MALMISIYEVMSGMTFRAHSLTIFISTKYIVATFDLAKFLFIYNNVFVDKCSSITIIINL